MFLRNKKFIAATLTFVIAAMSLSALPIVSAAEAVFFDDFEKAPESEYFIADSNFLGRFPTITRENGKLKITRSDAMGGSVTGSSTNWAQFILPASEINAESVTDTNKFVIEWDMEISTQYPTCQVSINGSSSVGLYNTTDAKNGKYYVLYDRAAKTIDYYSPDKTEALKGMDVPATADGSFDLKFIVIAKSAASYNTIDNLKIYPYYGMDAELSYKNEGGAEPDSVKLLLSDDFAMVDDLSEYITVDGEAVKDVEADEDNPMLYTVTFSEKFDFGSEHSLEIAELPSILNQQFSKELSFKVRERGLFVEPSFEYEWLNSGAQKIYVEVSNETGSTDDMVLVAAVYDKDGSMKAFKSYTLGYASGTSEFDFTVPAIEEGDTMEIFAAASLSDLDIIGTKAICAEDSVRYEKASDVGEAVISTATPVCNATELVETVTIKLPEGASDRYASLVVLKSGETVSDSNIYYIGSKKTEDGAASFNIKMADAKATHSYIWHTQGEAAGTPKSFNFYPKGYMDEGIEKLNDAAKAEVKGYMEDYAEALGIIIPDKSDAVIEYACYAFAGLRDEKYGEEDFSSAAAAQEIFDTAMFIALKGEDTGKFIEEFNTEYSFDEDIYKAYTDTISDGAVGAVKSSVAKGKVYSIKEVKELFNERVVLDGNSKADNYSQTKKLIEDLNELIGLDMTDYNKLSTAKKSKVAQALTGESFADFDEFADAFDDACDDAAKGGSSSSGGSGGGGGGRVSSSVPSGVYAEELAPSNEGAKKFSTFDDMEGYEWAIDAVEAYYDKGIINGKTADSFAPADNVTRAEISKILALALELAPDAKDKVKQFGDVTEAHWAYEYVALLSGKGIVNGVEEDVFGADMPLTRQMLVTILYRAAGEPKTTANDDFADMDDADEYAKAAMRYYKAAGAIEGVGRNQFMPQAPITRAEAVVMVSKCLAVK